MNNGIKVSLLMLDLERNLLLLFLMMIVLLYIEFLIKIQKPTLSHFL